MKCIEIITLRSLGKDSKEMVDELLRQVSEQKGPGPGLPASITVYQRPNVETDLSIHIKWEVEARNPGESPLGQRLSYALGGLGSLHHSLWVETASLE
jgi:hypothetical protein